MPNQTSILVTWRMWCSLLTWSDKILCLWLAENWLEDFRILVAHIQINSRHQRIVSNLSRLQKEFWLTSISQLGCKYWMPCEFRLTSNMLLDYRVRQHNQCQGVTTFIDKQLQKQFFQVGKNWILFCLFIVYCYMLCIYFLFNRIQ